VYSLNRVEKNPSQSHPSESLTTRARNELFFFFRDAKNKDTRARLLNFSRAFERREPSKMPAPGPKDGHASKASRDLQLTRGTSAKSNGFKYGGGTLDGATSVRTGISNSARDQLSRRKLRAKFLARKRKREEEEEEKEKGKEKEREDERRGTKGDETAKRRSGDDDDEEEDDESENENENKNKRRRTEQTESEAKEKEEEEKEETDAVTSSITFPWTCDVCEGKTMQSDHQRNDHLNSKKHKKNVAKRRGRELLKTMLGTS